MQKEKGSLRWIHIPCSWHGEIPTLVLHLVLVEYEMSDAEDR